MIRVLSREPDSSMLGLNNGSKSADGLEIKTRAVHGLLLLQGGRKASNPAIVALEGAAKNQLLSHDWNETMKGERMGGEGR